MCFIVEMHVHSFLGNIPILFWEEVVKEMYNLTLDSLQVAVFWQPELQHDMDDA